MSFVLAASYLFDLEWVVSWGDLSGDESICRLISPVMESTSSSLDAVSLLTAALGEDLLSPPSDFLASGLVLGFALGASVDDTAGCAG